MMGYLLDGGWMMLPLLFCSIGLLAVVIDRARAFRAAAIDHEALRKQVNAAVNDGDIDCAITLCEASTGPVAATILAGLLRLKRLRARQKERPPRSDHGSARPWRTTRRTAMPCYERPHAMVLIARSRRCWHDPHRHGHDPLFGVMPPPPARPGPMAGHSEALITRRGLLIAAPGVVATTFRRSQGTTRPSRHLRSREAIAEIVSVPPRSVPTSVEPDLTFFGDIAFLLIISSVPRQQ